MIARFFRCSCPQSANLLDLLLRVVEKAKEYDDALYAHYKFKGISPEQVLGLLTEGKPAQVCFFKNLTVQFVCVLAVFVCLGLANGD